MILIATGSECHDQKFAEYRAPLLRKKPGMLRTKLAPTLRWRCPSTPHGPNRSNCGLPCLHRTPSPPFLPLCSCRAPLALLRPAGLETRAPTRVLPASAHPLSRRDSQNTEPRPPRHYPAPNPALAEPAHPLFAEKLCGRASTPSTRGWQQFRWAFQPSTLAPSTKMTTTMSPPPCSRAANMARSVSGTRAKSNYTLRESPSFSFSSSFSSSSSSSSSAPHPSPTTWAPLSPWSCPRSCRSNP